MRSILPVVLSLALTSATLAGCAHPVAPAAPVGSGTVAAAAARLAPDASDFAALLKRQGYEQVRVKGTQVILKTSEVETIYDFANTAKTGKVRISASGYSFEIAFAKLVETTSLDDGPQDILPAVIVPIAIQVGVGGAIKLAHYALTHRGDKFKKDEAIKACVEGMLMAVVPLVRDVKYAQFLVPLAVALVSRAKSLSYKDLVAAANDMLAEIVAVLTQMLRAAHIELKAAKPTPAL